MGKYFGVVIIQVCTRAINGSNHVKQNEIYSWITLIGIGRTTLTSKHVHIFTRVLKRGLANKHTEPNRTERMFTCVSLVLISV